MSENIETKEARLILQFYFYQYFGRHGFLLRGLTYNEEVKLRRYYLK